MEKWIRIAMVGARLPYPPVSAWDFDFLKVEEVVKERLDGCTIYIIAQRPMVWFDNVYTTDDEIIFEITDHLHPPLRCRINPVRAGLCEPGDDIDIQFNFHRQAANDTPPLKDVAAIRIYDADGGFKVWWSPHKLLFEHIVNGLPVSIEGDLTPYQKFEVHYIGQAFDQKVWDRLKAHEQLQRTLVKEPARGMGHGQPSLEIMLFMLDIHRIQEGFLRAEGLTNEKGKPRLIIHKVPADPEDPATAAFRKDWIELGDEALTREVEAMLINRFEPVYNRVKFKHYPKLKGGLRDLGFTEAELQLHRFPFLLVNKDGVNPLDSDEEAGAESIFVI